MKITFLIGPEVTAALLTRARHPRATPTGTPMPPTQPPRYPLWLPHAFSTFFPVPPSQLPRHCPCLPLDYCASHSLPLASHAIPVPFPQGSVPAQQIVPFRSVYLTGNTRCPVPQQIEIQDSCRFLFRFPLCQAPEEQLSQQEVPFPPARLPCSAVERKQRAPAPVSCVPRAQAPEEQLSQQEVYKYNVPTFGPGVVFDVP